MTDGHPALPGPVLLYDGACGLCAASVQFILRHERQHSLYFAPLQGSAGDQIRRRHPGLRGIDSMVWVEPATAGQPERALVRSAAVLRVARYLGGRWRLAAATKLLPARLRDLGYDWLAQHRHSLGGEEASCFLPSAESRSRFLN